MAVIRISEIISVVLKLAIDMSFLWKESFIVLKYNCTKVH